MHESIDENSLYISDLKNIFNLNLPLDNLLNYTVLITGATGLIGSCLVDLLMLLNVRVIATGRNRSKAENRFKNYFKKDNFRFIEYDVTEKLNIEEKIDYIIHAASNANPGAFSNDPVGTMNANYIGTYNLLEFARSHDVKRFLYVSSGEVYGEGNGSSFKEEDIGYVDLLNVRSCYPISKRAGETLCISYSTQFNVDTVIARPCHIYGPTFTEKDNRVLSEFIRLGINGEDIVLKSSGRQIRSHCYVIDTVFGLLCVLLLGNTKEAYNISSFKDCATIKEIAEIIAEFTGVNVIAESCEDNGRMHAVLEDKKLRELGWEPIYNLEEGMRRTLDILKK